MQITDFISLRFLDFLDIFLVAILLFSIFRLIKGTTAINIFIGVFMLYLVWIIVRLFNMELLATILGQVIGVGVLALIIVFQQEIRRFLLLLGTQSLASNRSFIRKLFTRDLSNLYGVRIKSILRACISLSSSRTGALIVISTNSELYMYAKTGDIINADTTSALLESIFCKQSPLHDGAVIISRNKIYSARCILPVTDNLNLPPEKGLRHRAGVGISEVTDAFVIVISEETGSISIAQNGKIDFNISLQELTNRMEELFLK